MRRAGRKKKPITSTPMKVIVYLSSDEEHDCIRAERKENKQLNRINQFADANNLIPMKIIRRGIFGRRIRDELFMKAIYFMEHGKADAIVAVNMNAISDGIADAFLKVGIVKERGFRIITIDEKELDMKLYTPPMKEV